MEKLKKLFKNKKFLIGVGVFFLLIICVTVLLIIKNKSQEELSDKKVKKEETHAMYVKINPLVKLNFKVTYFECTDKDGKKYICSDFVEEVNDYELINNDAKDIYDTIDFKGKSVMDSLIILCDVARDNKVAFSNLEIVSDYKFDDEKILQQIKDGSKYTEDINILVDFKEILDENVAKDLESEQLKTFTISFDSNGGSKVNSQVVKENEVLKEVKNPTKKGYEFVEWQLNGKKYDFKEKVTSNFTLKAIWKKNTTTPNKEESNKKEEAKEEPTSTITSTIDKINLNENILVEYSGRTTKGCGSDIVFTDNIADVLADYYSSSYSETYKGYDKYESSKIKYEDYDDESEYYKAIDEDFTSKYNKLIYNESKATSAKNEIESYLKTVKGLKDYSVTGDAHSLVARYSFLYIHNSNSLENFGKNFNNYYYNVSQKINSIIAKYNGSRLAFGGCGDYNEPDPKVLTETICQEYHLNCARW